MPDRLCRTSGIRCIFLERDKNGRLTPAGSEKTHLLQPDQSISETVTFGQSGIPTRKFLRVIGGVKMPAPFQNRGEEMFRRSEFYIDDNLDSVIRKKDRYSLYFKGER